MAADQRDAHTVLGIDRSASDAEIRAAYLALVARFHPDRHQGNPLEDLARERMAEINQAYEELSDPARGAPQDFGRNARAAAAAGSDPGAGPAGIPRARSSPLAKWALLLLVVPFLVRGGAGLLRALAALARDLFAALEGFRGTPAAFVVALIASALLLAALQRRRRRRRRASEFR